MLRAHERVLQKQALVGTTASLEGIVGVAEIGIVAHIGVRRDCLPDDALVVFLAYRTIAQYEVVEVDCGDNQSVYTDGSTRTTRVEVADDVCR